MLQENTLQREFYDACKSGDIEVVKLLLDKGADINQVNSDGITPLSISCLSGHLATSELLISSGADINQADSNGLTPLWLACRGGHRGIV